MIILRQLPNLRQPQDNFTTMYIYKNLVTNLRQSYDGTCNNLKTTNEVSCNNNFEIKKHK